MSGKPYFNAPPIKETVCTFRFGASISDLTIPGRFQAKYGTEYPKKKQTVSREFGWQESKRDMLEPQVRDFIEFVQFLTEDERVAVQLKPNELSIHRYLRDPEWATYKQKIETAFAQYQSLLSEPPAIQGLSLRYRNEFALPEDEHGIVQLGDWLTAPVSLPQGMPQALGRFNVRCEVIFERKDQAELSMLMLYSLLHRGDTSGAQSPFVFEMTLHPHASATAWDDQGFRERWLTMAHEHIIDTFNRAFTPKAKQELFQEVQDDTGVN